MGNKNSKSMSGSYSMKGTVPADVGRVKKTSRMTNGSGPPSISYPPDPPDDENMNEIINENVDLSVLMPDGVTSHSHSIEPNIPMMDLLVNLSAKHKLNPAAHTLVVQTGDKWKQIDFKANKTIGLLAGEDNKVSVQIVKKHAEQKVRPKSTAQPFEMTYRFTVNLPQNQKKVLRISPKLLLGEVGQIVCQDKGYDPKGYVFLLPGKPKDVMDDNTSVGDLKSSEINFVSITMLDAAAAKSLPDLAFAASQAGGEAKSNQQKDNGQVPVEGQKKAKSRFLSFLGKKEKKLKMQTESSIEEPASVNRTRKTESFNVRPKTMYADPSELEHFNLRNTTSDLRSFNSDNKLDQGKSMGSSLIPLNENKAFSVHNSQPSGQNPVKEAPPKKSGKKRAAPPPPQAKPQTVQVEIVVKPKTPQDSEIHGNKSLQDDLPERVHVKRFHSRNSSDSSGYHELTLSGADSPDGVKINNLHTTIDTTSISSADHFNGDSGIRDMSPVRSRGHNKGNRAGGSRDSSLDIDKPDVPVPGGKKKKRAPLPPPADASDDELAALKAMEEVTMKFNIDDSDEETESGMKMVEDSSIYSEDLDVDLSHRQRPPATFVAPPPPTEPPPVDSEPVDMRFGVSTTDIGVGEDTTASPRSDVESVKNSPVNTPSLPGSSRRSSISSVNTIEDLSLAFKQIIAMGEEALGFDSDLSDNENVQDELQKEMGEFKNKISQLADEESDSGEHNESKNSDSSFIIHDTETNTEVSSDRADDVRGMVSSEGNRESSEITYEFTIDAVPAEFRNGEGEEEEEDEEHFEEEIVEILPADPKVFNMDSPRRIPDLESPKEHKSLAMVVHDSLKDGPVDISTPKEKPEAKVDEPKEKEEFVISLDELSNVEYSVSKPKEHSDEDMKQKETPRVNYRLEFRNSRDYNSHPEGQIEAQSVSNVQHAPVSRDDDSDMSGRSNIKNQCSELSFTPDYETEVEHVMEEKSISMMNFPAEQKPVQNSPETVNTDTNDNQTYASSTKLVLSQNNSMSSQGSETSPRKDSGAETPNLLQLQYQQLQQQFAVWQGQLVQNQQLLATNQNSPGDDQSNLQLQQLQLQIQMQQQMLFQMQQNMNALALQNSMASQQQQPVGMVTMQTMPTMPIAQQPFLVPTSTLTKEGAPIQNQRPASPVVTTNEIEADVPNAPPPPPTLALATAEEQPKKKTKQRRIKERVLEPREQLMLDIRNFGKKDLHKVPVKATKWHK